MSIFPQKPFKSKDIGIKPYVLDDQLKNAERGGRQYYELAKASDFDYATLWTSNPAEVSAAFNAARSAWMAASPLYEQMEGIVAGTPSLAEYDVILDAGTSRAEDPENAVPFDLTLPDGRVLPQPGHLFGILESTLSGTFIDYTSGKGLHSICRCSVCGGKLLPG